MKERGVFKITLKNEKADWEEMDGVVVVAVHPQEARDLADKESGDYERRQHDNRWAKEDKTDVERIGGSAADFSYVVLVSRVGR